MRTQAAAMSLLDRSKPIHFVSMIPGNYDGVDPVFQTNDLGL